MMWDNDAILRDLWNGRLRPNEGAPPFKTYDRVTELQNKLRGMLEPAQWQISESLCEAIRAADLYESECAFIAGFRLGMRLMLGLLTKSPLEKLRRFIPAYLTKILVNPQRIACVFCFICRKNRSCFLHGFVCQQPHAGWIFEGRGTQCSEIKCWQSWRN